MPQGFSDHQRLHAFVQQRQDWVEKHLRKIQTQQASKQQQSAHHDFPPQQLQLNALQQNWVLAYQSASRASCQQIAPHQLLIKGSLSETHIQTSCKEWLRAQAKIHLIPWTMACSQAANLPCQRVFIKFQKSCWGSCSSKANINLNAKLLFFPPPVVQYVIVHEIAHLKHPNHSPAFWCLLEQLHGDYRQHREVLKRAWEYVPGWL